MELQIDQLGKVAVTVDDGYWDINKDYDKLVIVEVKNQYKTYISRKPVPAGTSLSNRKYWIPFSSLKEEIKLDYNKWFDYYGELIGRNTTALENVEDIIKTLTTDKIDQLVINYFASEEATDKIKEVVRELLDELLAEYFEDIQQTLTNMERVIANALARHEAAITELQNQINTSN